MGEIQTMNQEALQLLIHDSLSEIWEKDATMYLNIVVSKNGIERSLTVDIIQG
jgi:hypothetical protein